MPSPEQIELRDLPEDYQIPDRAREVILTLLGEYCDRARLEKHCARELDLEKKVSITQDIEALLNSYTIANGKRRWLFNT